MDLRTSGRGVEARALHAHAFMPETQQQEDGALVVGNDNEPVAAPPSGEAEEAADQPSDDAVTQRNPRVSDEGVLPEHVD